MNRGSFNGLCSFRIFFTRAFAFEGHSCFSAVFLFPRDALSCVFSGVRVWGGFRVALGWVQGRESFGFGQDK